jgi:hypothetical protein
MRRTLTATTIIFFLSFTLRGQTDRSHVKKFDMVPHVGYAWQGTSNFELGLSPLILLDAFKNHNNIGLAVAANLLILNGSTYFTPSTRLRLFIHKRKLPVGWECSVGHSYTNINKNYDHRLTPEVGINWRGFHLTYGYNIPLDHYTDSYTLNHRIALRYGSH